MDNYETFNEYLITKLRRDREYTADFKKNAIENFMETKNEEEFLLALSFLVKAEGISKIAKESGISRNVFYKSLKPKGNPTFHTLLAILNSLSCEMSIKLMT